MKNYHRTKDNSFLRWMFANGVSLASLFAVVYYAGVIVERNDAQNDKLTSVQTTVSATQETVGQIKTEVAVVKSRVDTIEKADRLREWSRNQKERER